MKINILGTAYTLRYVNFGEDKYLTEMNLCGCCGDIDHDIVVLNVRTIPGWENESEENIKRLENKTLRHEILHAFLNESGLQQCSLSSGKGGWARNEEMVDWLAIQFPKILKAYKEAGCLEVRVD